MKKFWRKNKKIEQKYLSVDWLLCGINSENSGGLVYNELEGITKDVLSGLAYACQNGQEAEVIKLIKEHMAEES